MLTHIKISQFAIVESLNLDIPSQLSVITGETGAGKSIMIDALGLTLGDRADSGMVRAGAEKADIIASFDVSRNSGAQAWLASAELLHGDECLLRRVINQDGRSRGYINGTPATLQQLRELGETLVSIHGQHEHQTLLKRDTHRELLDEYAGHQALAREVRQRFRHWQDCDTRWRELRDNRSAMLEKAELLQFQVEELSALNPMEGELEALEREHKKLSNVETLLKGGQQVLDALSENDNNLIDQSGALLHQLQDMLRQDSGLQDVIGTLEQAQILLQDASASLQHYARTLEMDPERYEEVDQRLSQTYQLARKHRVSAHELAGLFEQLKASLEEMDGGDDRLAELEAAATGAWSAYLNATGELTLQRQQHALALADKITQQIRPLGMPGAEFFVVLTPLSERQASPHGMELVDFEVRTNPGQPAKALGKVASGGELSRISLAIQVACAARSQVATLIFDEVDVGIGGSVAQVVGRLLRSLGEKNQVLCVTHLPQVAAQGHHHLHVNKVTEQDSTHTGIDALNKEEKVSEIARMLGGVKITKQTLAHAKELIAESQAD
ncbi:ATPases involved in DNA repair [gamma proteobacterium HdN1]|nr:ATPases involved in DNA repair [gamma proteobacterium HdN1]